MADSFGDAVLDPAPGRRLVLSSRLVRDAGAPGALAIVPNRQAAGTLGISYVSLEEMALRTAEAAGLHPAPPLVARRLLERAAARTGATSDSIGLARTAESTVHELLRGGVDLEALRAHPSPRLSRLGSVAAMYVSLLAEQGLFDRAELMWRAADLAPRPAVLCVSGFPRLPVAERAFLDRLAAPGSVVHLPLATGPLFEENGEAARDFRNRGWETVSADEPPTGTGGALAAFWTGARTPGGSGQYRSEPALPSSTKGGTTGGVTGTPVGAVSAVTYPDLEAEARGTLASVKELLLNGVAPNEIAIAARHEDVYGPVLLRVAEEFGVPLRALYQVPLADTRLGSWTLDLLKAVAEDFPFETTARLLAHPLVRALEPSAWSTLRRERPTGSVQWARQHAALAHDCPESSRRSEYCEWLLATFEALGVRSNAQRWPRAALAYAELVTGLAGLPDRDRDIPFEAFASDVGELMRVLTVPARPGRGGVELHSPLSLFGARVEHLFVVGAHEGSLPAPVQLDPLLDPFEREELRAQGHEVESVSLASRREELSFWALLHAAGTTLRLSRPKLLGRKETLPSPYVARLAVAWAPAPPQPACSPAELRRELLGEGNHGSDVVLANARRSFEVEMRREGSTAPDEFDGIVGIPAPVPARGLGVTSLIDLATCPFKYFAANRLGLREAEESDEDLGFPERGRLYHRVLQLVMEGARGRDDARAAALESLDEAFARSEEELGLDELAGWNLQREQHLMALRRAVAGEEFLSPGARVRALEAEVGAIWQGIPVRGRADRIDDTPDGLELIDYKSGSSVSNLAKDAAGQATIDLQLSVYREATAALAPGERVAGTRYYSVSKARTLPVREPAPAELEAVGRRVREALESGRFPVDPDLRHKACQYCSFEGLCRRGPRLERKRGTS